MATDFIIISKPAEISFDCPFCGEYDVRIPFEDWDIREVRCPNCHKEVELGDWTYD